MSVINKMLQDLDKRHATADPDALTTTDSANLPQGARPAKFAAPGSHLFWRVMAGAMVVVVAWVIWVMWQIMPRSVVTDRAYQSPVQRRSPLQPQPQAPAAVPVATPASNVARQPAAPVPAATQPAVEGTSLQPPARVAAPVPPPATALAPPAPMTAAARPAAPQPIAAGAPPLAARLAVPEAVKIDMLRLATEITVPIRRHTARAVPVVAKARSVDRETIAAVKAEAGTPKMTESATGPAPMAEATAPRARTVAAAPDAGRIDKRIDATPRERAESEFRRAMGLVNQGRMAEGMDGLKATLAADSTYELARQTLVALLLESKRTDQAAILLQEGLAINPAHVGYGMLLARIHVEQGDPGGALALLQKFETTARTNAEYHAFVAALFQRLGRHIEALERYRRALSLNGGVGAWWVGLGISQEALDRQKDATDSFQRAKGTGNLSAELLAYVERRLKLLQ